MTLKLYYSPGACSLAPHIALEEAGAAFEPVKVAMAQGEQRSPAYLAINPKGRVPTIVDGDVVVTATRNGHVLHCKADEIAKLEGPGRGVTVIKVDDDDAVIGFIAGRKADHLVLETEKSGKKFEEAADPKQVSARGGKGRQIIKKATLVLVPRPVAIPPLANADGGQGVN